MISNFVRLHEDAISIQIVTLALPTVTGLDSDGIDAEDSIEFAKVSVCMYSPQLCSAASTSALSVE